jgi:lysozyme
MIHSKAARDIIGAFEGRRAKAYPDPATGGDPWTIGIGHTGREVHKGLVWSDAQIDAAFEADIVAFDHSITTLVGNSPVTQNQFDALLSLAFNIGAQNLKESTLLRLHKEGDYSGAAIQFARWNRAGGRPMAGLTRRRAAEAALYRGAV